jgi:hypothetical protein
MDHILSLEQKVMQLTFLFTGKEAASHSEHLTEGWPAKVFQRAICSSKLINLSNSKNGSGDCLAVF